MNVIFSNSLRDANYIASIYNSMSYKAKVVVSDNHNFKNFMFTVVIEKQEN